MGRRVLVAVIVGFLVGLVCIFLGYILPDLNVSFITSIGNFLTKWGWPIGLAAGLLSFATGWNPFPGGPA